VRPPAVLVHPMSGLVECVGCGGSFPAIAGPTHRYMESSPGCWAAYCEVLAREYANPVYRRLHRLTVDAYAVQHPGQPNPQAIQSVAIHLVSLCLVLERGRSAEEARRSLSIAAGRKGRYLRLSRPVLMGAITVADVRAAQSPEAHLASVRLWAESAWQAWTPHHGTVRLWADELALARARTR
jgi:hypothetical protein